MGHYANYFETQRNVQVRIRRAFLATGAEVLLRLDAPAATDRGSSTASFDAEGSSAKQAQ